MSKIVIPFSAGMDSTLLVFLAAEQGFTEIHTLSFDYGQRHVRELANVPRQLDALIAKYPGVTTTNKVLDTRFISEIATTSSVTNKQIDTPKISEIAGDAQPVTYVPFRNMMFLSICAAYAESVGADTIWYGATKVDSLAGMWDCDQNFIDHANKTIALNRKNRITIAAPLLAYDKADIVRKGTALGINWENTWTCYSNREDGLADATTPSSSMRINGFIEAGYFDPIQYVQQEQLDVMYEERHCVYPTNIFEL